MGDKSQAYSRGDWIVHLYHGLGQVKGMVHRRLGGKLAPYYRVETRNSTIWVPADNLDSRRIRPVAARSEFRKALRILKRPPRRIDTDLKVWRRRIVEVKEDGSLAAICRLVRDLSALKAQQRLNNTEKQALEHFTNILLGEWSVCKGIAMEEALQELDSMLQMSQ